MVHLRCFLEVHVVLGDGYAFDGVGHLILAGVIVASGVICDKASRPRVTAHILNEGRVRGVRLYI